MKIFVIAMDSEARAVLDACESVASVNARGKKVYSCTLCGEKTAVVVCGVGKALAAAATQYAVDCLGATAIINVGFAGGLNDGMCAGDVYAIKRCAQYDFDLVAINGTPKGTLNEFKEPYMELATPPLFPYKNLGTGDRFNDDRDDYEFLTKQLGADIRDMEGGAIAQICAHEGLPFNCFKAISDVAASGSTPAQFLANLELCRRNLQLQVEKIFKNV